MRTRQRTMPAVSITRVPAPDLGPRFVLYSKSRGVYLGWFAGRHNWANDDGAGVDAVPTFAGPGLADAIQHFITHGAGSTWDDCNLAEVDCDLPNGYVSQDVCVSIGLPPWNRKCCDG